MSNENPQLGEGFGAKPHRQNDRKASGMRKMVVGAVMTVAAVILGYFGIGLFVEGYQEYTANDTLAFSETVKADAPRFGKLATPRLFANAKETLTIAVDRGSDGSIDAIWDVVTAIRVVDRRASQATLGAVGWLSRAFEALQPNQAYALIVNAGENFLVDAFQGTVEPEILRYHGLGTSTTAPAETDTGCGTELTTQYNPDSTRATGTLTEGSGTNVFRTVATNTVDATVTIGEFCLMSQAATGGGTMWSRVLVSPTVGLNSGDSLQSTYDLTVE